MQFEFGSILWQFVSNRNIGSLHLLHTSGTMLNSCLCISYLGLLHLRLVSIVVKITFSECWHTVCQMANTHLLGVCVCIVCLGAAVFGTVYLNGSWFLTSQGYMLDWLGDVTCTVSSCQISGGVCYLTNLCAELHASYRPYWTYNSVHLCIF